jgi:hypothetical protein
MTCILEELQPRVADLLRALAARPLSLFCLLVAANAVALPYGNLVHDATLYGVQVLNRVYPGHFADDLYFRYGSQDKYSVFSLIAAPLVARLGMPVGFFVLYFLSNALFLFALLRFVRALVPDRFISTLALLFMAVTEMPFGGLGIFHINEPFLTPRIAANALVLLGLERLMAGQPSLAWGLVGTALPLHPLMAFPGILILAAWLGLPRPRWKWAFALLSLGALAGAVVFLNRSLGRQLLGEMDAAWWDSVHRVNLYLFPLDWRADDWLRIALSFVVALESIRQRSNAEPVRRLLIAMSGVAAVGLVGALTACFSPYALPLQGQPYRWLWPLELALYPLGFGTAWRLWAKRRTVARLAALGLLAYLDGASWDKSLLWLFAVGASLFGVIVWRGLSSQPRVADWPVRAAAFGLALSLSLWTAFNVALMAAFGQQLHSLLEPVEMLMLLADRIDPWCRLALLIGSLVMLARFVAPGWRLPAACSGIWATACLVFFVFPQTRYYAEYCSTHRAEERFVAEHLPRSEEAESTLTVFWPGRNVAFIWFQLRANVFFEFPHQIAGNLFNAGTAREGTRRAQLVKKFEMARLRQERILYSPQQLAQFRSVYGATENEPAPEVGDLLALCREKQLDFVVLPQAFPGLYAASNGKLFLYDCRAIRANFFAPTQQETLCGLQ